MRLAPNGNAENDFDPSGVSPFRSAIAFQVFALLSLLVPIPASAHAGLYYSGEHYAELPSRFRGFLVDHRALRTAAIERPRDVPVSPLREDFLVAVGRLEKLAKIRPLAADEAADLGALYVRLGKTEQALAVLQPAAQSRPVTSGLPPTWARHFNSAAISNMPRRRWKMRSAWQTRISSRSNATTSSSCNSA